jgi:hypothetical protein
MVFMSTASPGAQMGCTSGLQSVQQASPPGQASWITLLQAGRCDSSYVLYVYLNMQSGASDVFN